MKITFPHIGNMYIALKALFDGLGINYVIPPMNSKKELEIGSRYSHEEMCLPYKLMIGNYIQAADLGADTVLITGSCGPCRFGEYCELQMNLLNKLEYKLDFIVIDNPKEIGLKEFLKRISKISKSSKLTRYRKLQCVNYAIEALSMIDKLEAKANWLSGYEKQSGESINLIKECKQNAIDCNTPVEMINLLKSYNVKFDNIELDVNKKPIKIAIIGEFYTIIEPYANLFIEDKLIKYGVSTKREVTPSWWIRNLVLQPLNLNSIKIRNSSADYLNLEIGGFARQTIGEAVLAYEDGFDGAIQILPMGCMPEIVSKSILPKISKDKNFPIMSLVLDEMTGEGGYITRIEAFIDLLERRRDYVLSRN